MQHARQAGAPPICRSDQVSVVVFQVLLPLRAPLQPPVIAQPSRGTAHAPPPVRHALHPRQARGARVNLPISSGSDQVSVVVFQVLLPLPLLAALQPPVVVQLHALHVTLVRVQQRVVIVVHRQACTPHNTIQYAGP